MNIQKKLMDVRTKLRSGKDAYNSFAKYNYRNAESMLSAIKPLLAEEGLTLDFTDDVVLIGARFYLKTTLTVYDTEDGEKHATTHFAREPETRKGNDEAQITGASATYAHKYALMGMFAISDPNLDPDSKDNSGQVNQGGKGRTQQPQGGQNYQEPPQAQSYQGYQQGTYQNYYGQR